MRRGGAQRLLCRSGCCFRRYQEAVGLHQDQPRSFGDSNPHLHIHIVPKYEGGFEFGGSFAITNPEPVILKDEEYKEMIEALQKELGL